MGLTLEQAQNNLLLLYRQHCKLMFQAQEYGEETWNNLKQRKSVYESCCKAVGIGENELSYIRFEFKLDKEWVSKNE